MESALLKWGVLRWGGFERGGGLEIVKGKCIQTAKGRFSVGRWLSGSRGRIGILAGDANVSVRGV